MCDSRATAACKRSSRESEVRGNEILTSAEEFQNKSLGGQFWLLLALIFLVQKRSHPVTLSLQHGLEYIDIM